MSEKMIPKPLARSGDSHSNKLHITGPVMAVDVRATCFRLWEDDEASVWVEFSEGQESDVIREIFSTVPDKELDKLPTDLSYQLDHYLYGADKR